MNARPHNLTVLISTLVLTLTLAGCGYSPPSETTVTCQSLAPGETPDGLNTAAWTSGWERRYADHRGRYICKYESTGGCVETTDVVLYQFACTDGRCSCEVGGTWSEKPYRSARFTATAKEAFTSAASACEFDHRLASMEAPPSKPASDAAS